MPSHSKISKRKHLSKTIAIVLILQSLEKSCDKLIVHVQLFKFFVFTIIYWLHKQKTKSFRSTKRVDWSLKLTARNWRHLICHVKLNFFDNFAVLTSSSKKRKLLHRIIIRRYLKRIDYLRFKAKKKFYLTLKYQQIRLKWARKYLHWTLQKWLHVIWIDELIFETDLDNDSSWIIKKKALL